MNKKILVIAGMTGLGKSDLAYKIASKTSKQIIIGDSVQLYKNFPIGSNYPKYTNQIQYHLLGQFDALQERISCSSYKQHVMSKINQIDNDIIIEGGSCFYLNYLLSSGEEQYTQQQILEAEQEVQNIISNKKQADQLIQHLKSICPTYDNSINPSDFYRIEKALKFAILSNGQTFTNQTFPQSTLISQNDVRGIFLYSRSHYVKSLIDFRCDNMILNGYIQEFVNFQLENQNKENMITDKRQLIVPIGYEECRKFINFLKTYQTQYQNKTMKQRENLFKSALLQFVADFQVRTRQYAFYQRKYFKQNLNQFYWINVERERNIEQIVQKLYDVSPSEFQRIVNSLENQLKKKEKESDEVNKKMRENPLFGCLEQVIQMVNQEIQPKVKQLNPIRSMK